MPSRVMSIGIIGSGYVGTVTGAGLAELGNEVIFVDLDHERVAALNGGESPIFEPGLDELLA
jgi:UDPglucose 6-dehydrogenase